MGKEVMIMRATYLVPIVAIAAQLAGCLAIDKDNIPPVAVAFARVGSDPVGASPIPFTGDPVTVTLDGSKSSDKDGKIVKYKWLRTDISAAQRNAAAEGAAGMAGGTGGAAAPMAPAFDGDPPASASPTITLTEKGKYRFTLWVQDDKDTYSAPASVKIEVGGFMPDAMCVAAYMQPKVDCQMCGCTPNALGGCLDEVNNCLNNADPMFASLCSAVVNCAIEKKCAGTACYTNPAPNNCMAEIDAAAAFTAGGTAATACPAAMAMENPCGASGALSACLAAPTCAAVCM